MKTVEYNEEFKKEDFKYKEEEFLRSDYIIELLNHNNLVGVYEEAYSSWSYYASSMSVFSPAKIVKFLYSVGIDILEYYDYIPSNCFLRTDISKINIKSNLKRIDSYAFCQTPYLEEITIPGNIEIIGNGAFLKSALEKVVLEEGVEEICIDAFKKCYYLKEIVLPSSLRMINNLAFKEPEDELDNLTAIVKKGSFADFYCGQNDINRRYI